MKTEEEILDALSFLPSTSEPTRFNSMTFEQGWEEALLWVTSQEPSIKPPKYNE